MSLELGVLLSQLRDSASGTGNREAAAGMPALIAATMGETQDPPAYGYTLAGRPYDFAAAGGALHGYVTGRAKEIEGSFHVGLVNFLNGVRDLLGVAH